MSLRPQFTEFRSKIADRSNYPDVPEYVKEKLLERLDAFLVLEDGVKFEYKAAWFPRGASYYLAEECGDECDELFDDMPKVESPKSYPKP